MAVGPDTSASTNVVLRRAFTPWHKRALGLAVGFTAALLVAAVTAFHVIVDPPTAPNLALLSNYFYGYDVSWRGVFVGAWWSFVAGFVVGWFTAFLVNFFVATRLLLFKAKADLSQTTDFLDHL
jgi:hypothetical protein